MGDTRKEFVISVNISDERDEPNRRHIEKALKVIRKPYIHETVLDKLKEQASLSKFTKKNPPTESHRFVPYSLPESISLRPLVDIKQEARSNYRIYLEQSKNLEKSYKLVKPRNIYMHEVNRIKREILNVRQYSENTALKNEQKMNDFQYQTGSRSMPHSTKSQKVSINQFREVHESTKPRMKKSFSESKIISDTDTDTFDNEVILSMMTAKRRLSAQGFVSRQNPVHRANQLFRDDSPKANPHTQSHDLTRYEQRMTKILGSHRQTIDMQEKNLLIDINLKEKSRIAKEKIAFAAKKWLIITAAIKGYLAFEAKCNLTRELLRDPMAVLSPHARQRVNYWMVKQRIKLKLKRNPLSLFILSGFFRRCQFLHQREKRIKAITLIKQFLKDSKFKTMAFKNIYQYRAKLLKAQSYIRGWIQIQRARIELLYLAKEKYDRDRKIREHHERIKNQEQATKATENMVEFSDTMNELKHVKTKFHRLFKREAMIMKHSEYQTKQQEKEKEKLRKEIMEHEAAYRKNGRYMLHPIESAENAVPNPTVLSPIYPDSPNKWATTKTNMLSASSQPKNGRSSVRFDFDMTNEMNASTRRLVSPKQANISSRDHDAYLKAKRSALTSQLSSQRIVIHPHHWYERCMRHPETRRRIELLRDILMSQRRRHIVNRHMEEQEMKYKARKVDIRALKAFLKDPLDVTSSSSQVALSYEDTSDFVLTWNRRVKNVFLLLSQGGYEALLKIKF